MIVNLYLFTVIATGTQLVAHGPDDPFIDGKSTPLNQCGDPDAHPIRHLTVAFSELFLPFEAVSDREEVF